jgi:Holliday junction resolvasome RuvABC endonuclease subunit
MGGPGGLVVLQEGIVPRVLWERELPKGLGNSSLFQILREAVDKYHATCISCERPFTGKWDKRPSVGMHQRELLGVVKLVAQLAGIQLFQFAPQTVKARCGGHGRASKERMTARMKLLFHIKSDSDHVADAVALASCALRELDANNLRKRLK